MCSVGALFIAVLDLSVLQQYFLVYITSNWISDPIMSVVMIKQKVDYNACEYCGAMNTFRSVCLK